VVSKAPSAKPCWRLSPPSPPFQGESRKDRPPISPPIVPPPFALHLGGRRGVFKLRSANYKGEEGAGGVRSDV